MSGIPPEGTQEVPLILLHNVSLTVGRNPANPNEKMILIGPVFFGLPLSDEGAKAVVQGLTGIQIVSAAEKVH